ncbi:MAG TPA: phosphoribosylanthranilate isomerase [Pirellulales bacterium]|jgi:phosphoribosylanthranilate isomerase|nr:phosphoribosylanthranilate isomerase [Pirellulales bacterium]
MSRLPFQIKICGVTSSEDAAVAIEHGAGAIGLNFFTGSRRHIDPLEAQNIARVDSHELAVVGVFVNHTVSEIASIVTHVEPTWVQLHGDELPKVIKHVKEAVDLPIMRALRWGPEGSTPIDEYLKQCAALNCLPDAVLIDAHKPGEYGGTGETADWEAIARWREKKQFDVPLVLAGGLTPENVAEAIRIVKPDAVDTASGVEFSVAAPLRDADPSFGETRLRENTPGKKDPARVKAFIEEAKRAFAAVS